MGFETLVTVLSLQEVYKKSTRKLQESLKKNAVCLEDSEELITFAPEVES